MKVVIIGSAKSGLMQVQKLQSCGMIPEEKEIVICEKTCLASFGQSFLRECCAKSQEEIATAYGNQETLLKGERASLRLLTAARLVDPVNRVVTVQKRESDTPEQLPYDLLILATGRTGSIPDVPGSTLQGVMTLENLEDLLFLKEFTKSRFIRNIVVHGEDDTAQALATALRARGKDVTVLSPKDSIMGFEGNIFVSRLLTRQGEVPCDLYVSRLELDRPGDVIVSLPEALAPDGRLTADAAGKIQRYEGIYAAGRIARG